MKLNVKKLVFVFASLVAADFQIVQPGTNSTLAICPGGDLCGCATSGYSGATISVDASNILSTSPFAVDNLCGEGQLDIYTYSEGWVVYRHDASPPTIVATCVSVPGTPAGCQPGQPTPIPWLKCEGWACG
jgi:hypothetical protein